MTCKQVIKLCFCKTISDDGKSAAKKSDENAAATYDYTKFIVPVLSSSAPERAGEWTEVTARYKEKRLKRHPPASKEVSQF